MYETYKWGLKFLIAEYNYLGENSIFNDNNYLLMINEEDYSSIKANLPDNKEQLKEDINEFNANINFILNLVNVKYKERISDFQTRFNQVVWAKITELGELVNVSQSTD